MWNFDSRKGPLYQQLADRVASQILTGEIKVGDKLASARELAITVGLNPNTVVQAFQELEKREITETRRGKGTFVRETLNVEKLKQELLASLTQAYLHDLAALGISTTTAIKTIKDLEK